jgi:hypothetical protein
MSTALEILLILKVLFKTGEILVNGYISVSKEE